MTPQEALKRIGYYVDSVQYGFPPEDKVNEALAVLRGVVEDHEKARPLLEAVMKAKLVRFSGSDIGGYEPHVQRILRTALTYRAKKEKP